jgi:uncharacterized protein YhbP (UPF0306 family)
MERVLEPAELRKTLEKLLGLSTMTLATSSTEGGAHAADVYFACDEQLSLYFFSDPESQHSSDIQRDARAAVTIHADRKGWEQILGVQMRGHCEAISTSGVWEQAWEVYLAKFPFVSNLEEVIKVNQLYGFSPDWIRLVDNSQGFGFKQEWIFMEIAIEGAVVRRWEQLGGRGDVRGQTHG